MKSLIFFLLCALVLLCFSGCAINGDVSIYSPSGDENSIAKTVEADSNVGLK